jgi:hypothetical protein
MNSNYLNPARNTDESFEEYKVRRAANNKASKQARHATILWDSSAKGTYVRKQHGDL